MGLVEMVSPHVFGIDLGTSNSGIAVAVSGEARIIPIEGANTCPSVVNVTDQGEILVGRVAKRKMLVDPDNTVASIKREMGGQWNKEFSGLPGQQFSPADISSRILMKLVSGATEQSVVDLQGMPKNVILTVPANFNDAQKEATREAARLANLEVLEFLAEPIAAAIAYADKAPCDQTILVYDLGGGTFDVSILKVDSKNRSLATYRVRAAEGVPRLGGDDFDWKIMEMATARLKECSGIDILDLTREQPIPKKALRQAQQQLKEAAEQAKWELSTSQSARIQLPSLIKDGSGEVHNLDFQITREEFEQAIRDLILQSREAVERALASANMSMDDISRIILVGGSTRVRLVRTMLREMFDRDPYADEDPDIAVARGAAIYGARQYGAPDEQVIIHNIVRHFLGIETRGGHFSCMIEKGLEIPADEPLTCTKTYTTSRDNQTELAIRIYQSDHEADSIAGDGAACIGEFFLTHIPPQPKGEEEINVTFAIDRQNTLKVSATSSSSAEELEIVRT